MQGLHTELMLYLADTVQAVKVKKKVNETKGGQSCKVMLSEALLYLHQSED